MFSYIKHIFENISCGGFHVASCNVRSRHPRLLKQNYYVTVDELYNRKYIFVN